MMQLRVLIGLMICFLAISCGKDFSWHPSSLFVGDHKHERMVDNNGKEVKCYQPELDKLVAITLADWAALVAEIRNVNSKKLNKRVHKIEAMINQARSYQSTYR